MVALGQPLLVRAFPPGDAASLEKPKPAAVCAPSDLSENSTQKYSVQ